MFDQVSLFNILVTTGFAVIGWFCRVMWDAVQELRKDLSDLQVEIPKEYVPKNDFREGMTEIKRMFEIITDKLDRKADK